MEYKNIDKVEEIYKILLEFEDVFPGLKKRVSDFSTFALKLSKYAEVYVGVIENKNVGLVVFYANDVQNKVGYISLIGLKEAYQNKGLGTKLFSKCVEILKRRGMNVIRLEVDNQNEYAKQFYAKHGFVVIDVASENSIYMEKRISDYRY